MTQDESRAIEPRKIQVSICSGAGINHHCMDSMLWMIYYMSRTSPHKLALAHTHRTFIHMARKECAKRAIDTGMDYLLFLDDDMIFPANTVNRLVEVAERDDIDIVSGYYCSRKPPTKPLIYIDNNDSTNYTAGMPRPENRNILLECDATGLGCCLIRPRVFQKVEQPWFEIPDSMTEDTYFFRKVRKEGIKVFVDCGLPCGHVGDWGIIYPYDNKHIPPSVRDRVLFSEDLLSEHLVSEEDQKREYGSEDYPPPERKPEAQEKNTVEMAWV